jgi:Peptidase family S41
MNRDIRTILIIFIAVGLATAALNMVIDFPKDYWKNKRARIAKELKATAPANKTLTLNQAREEFTYFRKLVDSVHPGMSRYASAAEMNALFDSLYHSINGKVTTLDLYRKVLVALDRISCSHTYARLDANLYDSLQDENAFFPYPILFNNNKVYVNSNTFDDDIPLGTEITRINGENTEQVLQKLAAYNSVDGVNLYAENREIADEFRFHYYLAYGKYPQFDIEYRDTSSGNLRNDYTDAGSLQFRSQYYGDDAQEYDMEVMDDKQCAVLTINTLDFDYSREELAFSHFLENSFRLLRSAGIRNLVIDLRNNPGGSNDLAMELNTYLFDKPLRHVRNARANFQRVPFRAHCTGTESGADIDAVDSVLQTNYAPGDDGHYYITTTANKTWYPSKHAFTGNVIVLQNPGTNSAASMICSYLKSLGRATLVGEETGASYEGANAGFKLRYTLPKTKIEIILPVMRYEYDVKDINGPRGRGVIPDVKVVNTVKDMLANKDAQLEYVFQHLLK